MSLPAGAETAQGPGGPPCEGRGREGFPSTHPSRLCGVPLWLLFLMLMQSGHEMSCHFLSTYCVPSALAERTHLIPCTLPLGGGHLLCY